MFTFKLLNKMIKTVHPLSKFDLFFTTLYPLYYIVFSFLGVSMSFFLLMQHLSNLLHLLFALVSFPSITAGFLLSSLLPLPLCKV